MCATVWWLKVALFCCAALQGVVKGTEVQCATGELPCQDRTGCYTESARCDEINDCLDGTDEEGCESSSCTEDQFTCDNDHCIAKDLECNGHSDCDDGSDEVQCDHVRSCEHHEFTCMSDHQCINAILRCDGQSQCRDGSDELNCTVRVTSREPAIAAGSRHRCANSEFDCNGDGIECIPLSRRCDKTFDCSNEADESIVDCPSPNEVIEEQNQEDEIGEDSAPVGCEDAMCSHICTDDDGGYQCSCHEGYTLANDSHNCNLAPASGVEMLWVTDGKKLFKFQIYNGTLTEDDVGHHMNAIDVDFRHKKAFFIASDNIYEMNSDLTGVTPFVVSTTESRPSALGYDWIHRNLYWSAENKIEVVSVARKFRRNLIVSPNVTYAISMAVDPRTSQGYIYWGQGSDGRPGIYRAGLDGSNPERIVGTNVEHPIAMTIDFIHGQGRLLWLDSYAKTIRSYDMETRATSLIYEIDTDERSMHVNGLAYLSGHIYWADRTRGHVYAINEEIVASADSSEYPVEKVLDDLSLPKNLLIFNLVKQPSGHNRCGHNNGGCSHICLPTPATASVRHRCFCPNVGTTHTYKLNTDHKTCSEQATSGVHRSSSGKQNTKTLGDGSTREVLESDGGQAIGSASASIGLSVSIGVGAAMLNLLIGSLVRSRSPLVTS